MPPLVQQKLEAFEQLQPEFEASFQFVQQVHGQKRFSAFPVAYSVRYIHARWVCGCKGRLLSVQRTVKEDEGRLCLQLLRKWQEGDTASVVAFLYRKLDMLPLAGITQQIQEARRSSQDDGLVQRLEHGRLVMLNSGMHLLLALDAIFALKEEDFLREVRAACEQYGHLPQRIEEQLEQMTSMLYSYMPHQVLAQRNMLVMNKLGVDVLSRPLDLPGKRSWRVVPPTEPLSPFAEHVVEGYQELVSPFYNNVMADRFIDRPERSDAGEV